MLENAMGQLLKVTEFVEETSNEAVQYKRTIEIQKMLVGGLAKGLQLVSPTRRFILEGPAVHVNKEEVRVNLFLFSDLLLITEKRDAAKLTLTHLVPVEDNILSVLANEDSFLINLCTSSKKHIFRYCKHTNQFFISYFHIYVGFVLNLGESKQGNNLIFLLFC